MAGGNPEGARLARLGITVEPVAGGAERRYAVRGDTYPHRQALQELGGRWDKLGHVWLFDGPEDPSPRLAAAIGATAPAAGGAPDGAGANRPHYWGHRQRLRERALAGGLAGLPDYELLELILFGSIARVDVKPLAKALLERFGSLGALLAAPTEELARFELVDQKTIVNLRALGELAHRLARAELLDQPLLNSIDKVAKYCRAQMAHSDVERFRVLYLDQRHALIQDETQQTGTVNEVAAYPREIVRRALNLGAVGIVLVHNHPSGNLKPSPGDIEITREIARALEGVGIALHDHLIVGRNGHVSLREMGKLPR
jgi:DNA repair protein RadC